MISFPSTAVTSPAVITGAVVSGLEFGSFGSVPLFFSSSSDTPSLSSSSSFTSGLPSLSVSL